MDPLHQERGEGAITPTFDKLLDGGNHLASQSELSGPHVGTLFAIGLPGMRMIYDVANLMSYGCQHLRIGKTD